MITVITDRHSKMGDWLHPVSASCSNTYSTDVLEGTPIPSKLADTAKNQH